MRYRSPAQAATAHRFQYATKQYRSEDSLDLDLAEMVSQGWDPKFMTITLSRRIFMPFWSYNVYHVTYEWDAENDPRED
jgi:hypothetical protein